MLQRWAETEGLPAVSYTTSFEQDSIRVRSHTSGANTAIKYEVLVRFVDTKSVYALFTAARQFAVVFKGSLDAAQRDALKAAVAAAASSPQMLRAALEQVRAIVR